MRNVNVSDSELIAYSEDHLRYELQYLWFSAKELRRATPGSEMTSVLIDAFVIHLRNLIDFFCTGPGSEREDDVIASDFCPGLETELVRHLERSQKQGEQGAQNLDLQTLVNTYPTSQYVMKAKHYCKTHGLRTVDNLVRLLKSATV